MQSNFELQLDSTLHKAFYFVEIIFLSKLKNIYFHFWIKMQVLIINSPYKCLAKGSISI